MTTDCMKSNNYKSSEKWIGLTLLGVGVLILLRNLNLPLPSILFSWPMILIVIGLVIAFKEGFKGTSWVVLMSLGGFFLVMKLFPEWHLRNFIAPAILITIGLAFILRRKTPFAEQKKDFTMDQSFNTYSTTTETTEATEEADLLDVAAVFGAVKKNVYSKNFKGGEAVSIFGGSEINLMHADFTGTIKLEIVNIFGGTTLFIPAHWQIRSEAAAIFGAIEDKRQRPAGISTDKVLLIDGFVMFGGIDIKSL
jgi:predicted membrane protein